MSLGDFELNSKKCNSFNNLFKKVSFTKKPKNNLKLVIHENDSKKLFKETFNNIMSAPAQPFSVVNKQKTL